MSETATVPRFDRSSADDLLHLAAPRLFERARAIADDHWGSAVTFSPKAFLPITNLCRNRCDYCAFRRSPGDPGTWTMSPEEVIRALARASELGCIEALLCLGDTPETAFSSYRRLLESWGFESTAHYLRWAGEEALRHGLIPHTNAGILSEEELRLIRPVNASMGLMLESVSDRLCEPGQVHHRAPDKRPAVRIAMTERAGQLRIPFTSGLLVGIGETLEETIDTISAIADLHRRFGHIQEVIVQNFRAHAGTRSETAEEPSAEHFLRIVALARCLLPPEISLQAPPNLLPCSLGELVAAGINDLGGISPMTPDYINPGHAWPHLGSLATELGAMGRQLRARLPVYPRFINDTWLDEPARGGVSRASAATERWAGGTVALEVHP
jgi:FO synthase